MSAKARFLQKLQDNQIRNGIAENKSQADIAEFRKQMNQLQEKMEAWLADTGIRAESTTFSYVELLAGGSAFSIQGIQGIHLRYENRKVKFTPVFLYGQGVTGCVEVSLCNDNNVTPLCRMFMRSGESTDWVCSPSNMPTGHRRAFGEEAFFDMVEGLLP
jgi:hypothetical protein